MYSYLQTVHLGGLIDAVFLFHFLSGSLLVEMYTMWLGHHRFEGKIDFLHILQMFTHTKQIVLRLQKKTDLCGEIQP